MNEEKICFYLTDVTKTESIAHALKNVVLWSHDRGRPLGGVIAAAGIGSAERVRKISMSAVFHYRKHSNGEP